MVIGVSLNVNCLKVNEKFIHNAPTSVILSMIPVSSSLVNFVDSDTITNDICTVGRFPKPM